MTDEAYQMICDFARRNRGSDGKALVKVSKCLPQLDPPRLLEGDEDRFSPEIFVCSQDLADLDRRLYADAALDRGTDGRHR